MNRASNLTASPAEISKTLPIRTIGQCCLSRENNFDFIRFILALAVIYTHSYDLPGQPGEAIFQLTHQQLPASAMAVPLFFVISGFLVTQSWERSGGFLSYAAKRVRRIMPGFVGVILFCLLVVGPLSASSIGEYLTDRTVARFATLLCFKGPQVIASVFKDNPHPGNMNGSLWTIRYELLCYAFVAGFGLVGLLRRKWAVAGFVGLTVITEFWLKDLPYAALVPLFLRSLFALFLPFGIGMALYVWRDVIPLSRWLAALCLLGLIGSCYGGLHYTYLFFTSYVLFYVAFSRTFRVHHFARKADLSYGVYLYAFPVQQLIVQYLSGISALLVFGLASVVSCVLAWFSWTFIEHPFLRSKSLSRASGGVPGLSRA